MEKWKIIYWSQHLLFEWFFSSLHFFHMHESEEKIFSFCEWKFAVAERILSIACIYNLQFSYLFIKKNNSKP